MKISCDKYPFLQKWDVKLNKLLDEGVVTNVTQHTINFKLKVSEGIKPYFFFWEKERFTSMYYEVWVCSIDSSYGTLWRCNGESLPEHMQFAASQETLNKLFELETRLRNHLAVEAYK